MYPISLATGAAALFLAICLVSGGINDIAVAMAAAIFVFVLAWFVRG